jgi:RNA polymerase sigma-70 factor (ECF subfamily)
MSQLSPDAFADQFTACSRTLWCVAAAILGNPGSAEDVLQEAAIIALRKLDQFDADTSFPAWMTQIVRYVALNTARRRSRHDALAVDPVHLDETVAADTRDRRVVLTAHGQVRLDAEGIDDELLAALGRLDADARACLLLRVVMEQPYREIARTLGLPEGTAMSHVHRARRALNRQLTAPTVSGSAR